jgi:1-acyl-sn-glycerol-3-phosphate acyltransferase
VHLFPRKTVTTIAGPPVDLSPWAGKQSSARALREATAAIMSDVTGLLGQLRGEEPPAVPFDPAAAAVQAPDGAPGIKTEKRAL